MKNPPAWVKAADARKDIDHEQRGVLNCCGKMHSLRRADLPGSFNLPKQLRMFPSRRAEANRCLFRPSVVIETEDHRAAKEPGGRYEYCDDKQRDSEGHPGPAAIWTPARLTQYQHQPGTRYRGGAEPTMRHQNPGRAGQAKTPAHQPRAPAITAVRVPNQMQ